MKQIKDFYTSDISNKNNDYFIFQRDVDGVTYKISHTNIIKDCIKYTDTNFVQSLDWSKIINRPLIACAVSGKASGTGSINLNSTTPTLTLSISELDLSSVALGFVPVTQLGTKKISLEWNSSSNALVLSIDSPPNQITKGPIAMKSDLTWSNILTKPTLSFTFSGMIAGSGAINLMSSREAVFNITDITMKSINWTMLISKPTLKFGLTGDEIKILDFDLIGNNEEKTIWFDAFHSKLDILAFGNQMRTTALYMLSSPDVSTSDPSQYSLGIIRGSGIDDVVSIINTANGCVARSKSLSSWNTWNPKNPSNASDWSYKNRIELFPLLVTPYLITTKQRVTELVANTIDVLTELKYNGVSIDLAKLLTIIAAH